MITTKAIEKVNEEDALKKSLYDRFFRPLIVNMNRFVEGKMPKQKQAQIEKRLQAAGYPYGLSASHFIIIQHTLPSLLFLLFLVFFVPNADDETKAFFFSVFAALLTYFYLTYFLKAKSKQRVELIERSMPDFFDLLNVSIEAGLGLDGALRKVCQQMKSPLSDEFFNSLEDMKLGKSRKQAFTEIINRVPSDFLSSVLNSIIQADQMGMGMSKVLRAQTTRIRERHRFNAKEKAMKAPVKMLIPMVLFIFPTLFIVLLGPVIINLVTEFF